jgi:ABC-2 type transport system ATP-binding protein
MTASFAHHAALVPPADVVFAPALPKNAIELRGLTKVYGRPGSGKAVTALGGIDLAVPRGSIFGLLGPNGAGKSTTINILSGIVVKTGGTARIWTHDIDRDPRLARSAIGIVPQELNIDPFFTPRELLELQAGLYGVPRRERRTLEILDAVGLADKADAYSRTLSGGMRRRLMVAKAMVHSPPVLVLDEPTAGVDVELRQQLWAYVRDLNRRGTTILLTTHYLEEAQEMCDRIAIINRGRVVADEPTATLLKRIDAKQITVTVTAPVAELPPSLLSLGVEKLDATHLRFSYHPTRTSLGPVLDAIAASGLAIRDVTTEEADLHDVFLRLTSSGNDAAPL